MRIGGALGRIDAEPGTPTAVAGVATALVDQRHVDPDALRELHQAAVEAGRTVAAEEHVEVDWSPLFRVSPIHFDAEMIRAANTIVIDLQGHDARLPSGPLHDAARVAEAGVPTVMLFVRSKHTRARRTPTRPT